MNESVFIDKLKYSYERMQKGRTSNAHIMTRNNMKQLYLGKKHLSLV